MESKRSERVGEEGRTLGGISNAEYDPLTGKLRVRGWFLGPPVDRVDVYLNDLRLVGQAQTGMYRSDILEHYPEYANGNSGWRFEEHISTVPEEGSHVVVRLLHREVPVQIYRRAVKVVGLAEEPPEEARTGIGEPAYEREFLAQTSNLVNKLLFELAALTPEDVDRCFEDDDLFAIGMHARCPGFMKALAERFGMPLEVVAIMCDYEQKAWALSIRRRLMPGVVPSLRGKTTQRLVIYQKNVEALQNLLRLYDGPKDAFFDIGCQFGYLLVAAAQAGFERVVGVEIKPHFTGVGEDLRKFVQKEYDARLEYHVGDFGEIEFGSDGFSLITCVDVLEHTPDLKKTVRNMQRICAPGGLIYVYQGNAESLMMATKEPHYQLPAIAILPKELSVAVLEHIGKVNDRAGYMVSAWPKLSEIRESLGGSGWSVEHLDREVNPRNGQPYPSREELSPLVAEFESQTRDGLMPQLTRALQEEVQFHVEEYLSRIKRHEKGLDEEAFREKYLMASWNLTIHQKF